MCRAHGIPHQKVTAVEDLETALRSAWGCNRHSGAQAGGQATLSGRRAGWWAGYAARQAGWWAGYSARQAGRQATLPDRQVGSPAVSHAVNGPVLCTELLTGQVLCTQLLTSMLCFSHSVKGHDKAAHSLTSCGCSD